MADKQVDRPAPSTEAMEAAREIVRQQQIYDRASFVMMPSTVAEIIDSNFEPLRRQIAQLRETTEAFVKFAPAIRHMWRGMAMPEYRGRTLCEWINEAERALSSTATEKTEAENG